MWGEVGVPWRLADERGVSREVGEVLEGGAHRRRIGAAHVPPTG